SSLAITEAQADSVNDALPNLETLDMAPVPSGTVIGLELALKAGWKINQEAPSSLTLFDMGGARPRAVARFGTKELQKKQVMLPALEHGAYRLQGTLYYCEDKEGSQCLIKSFQLPVMAGNGDKTTI